MKKLITTSILFVLLVLEQFKDKSDHKTVYNPGDHLETDDLSRVNDLVKRGLAKIETVGVPEENANGAGADGAGANGKGNEVTPGKVAFDGKEYDPKEIKNALIAAGVAVSPNAGVNGLTKKIGELSEEQANAIKEKLNVTE